MDSDSLRPHSGYQPSPRFAGAFFFADGTLSRFPSSPLLCLGTGAIQPNCDFLPRIAEHHHDLRSDQNAESRTHNQYDTDSDVMQIARLLDRHVESSKIVHAALLLLMLEAALRTSFHHQPEAQHPFSSAIHKRAGRLPHLWVMCGRRLIGKSSFDVDAALVGCGHVSGLFVRR